MATPHIGAETGAIAQTVLMPGDPLRAKFIAETYLEDPVQYNNVRGMLGFTGTYHGKKVSIQGSGMGTPSMGIYSYELYKFFGVENIIRIGTAGSLKEKLKIGDLIFGQGTSSTSNYAFQYNLPGSLAALADFTLLETAVGIARQHGRNFQVGNILCSDVFYDEDSPSDTWKEMGVLAVEMESYALYLNAAKLGKRALTILTVSDEIYSGRETTAEERRTAFTDMMEVALETACRMPAVKATAF